MPVLSETEMSARGLAPLGEAYLEGDADATTPRRAEREEETREPATDSDDGVKERTLAFLNVASASVRSGAVEDGRARRSGVADVDRGNARGRARRRGERRSGSNESRRGDRLAARAREATRVGARAIGGGGRDGTRAGCASVVDDDESRRDHAPARIARGIATAATAEAAAMLAC
jgi:hypothetical protein